jgi:hypothetical protein
LPAGHEEIPQFPFIQAPPEEEEPEQVAQLLPKQEFDGYLQEDPERAADAADTVKHRTIKIVKKSSSFFIVNLPQKLGCPHHIKNIIIILVIYY